MRNLNEHILDEYAMCFVAGLFVFFIKRVNENKIRTISVLFMNIAKQKKVQRASCAHMPDKYIGDIPIGA